jgi:hypothetical protein
MSTGAKQTGRCLCGKVTFTIGEPASEVGACHCGMCRRWAGGASFALHCKGPVAFEGKEHIVRYRSSDWAERGFCGSCGSNLFYHLLGADQYMMSPCALDDQSGLKLTSQIFIDEKPGWYAFANETVEMTGAEVFALYAPKDEGQG